jgi:hypothetical protein
MTIFPGSVQKSRVSFPNQKPRLPEMRQEMLETDRISGISLRYLVA